MSKTRASCFIRGSRHLETIKALGLRPRAFISFSVFGTPDETLALVLTYYVIHTWGTDKSKAVIGGVTVPQTWREHIPENGS